MQSDIPKQYLQLGSSSVLYLSAKAFLDHPRFTQVHIGISEADDYFDSDSLAQDARVIQYKGGSERFNTVLNGLDALVGIADEQDWVWVHDAARPCLSREDIDNLIEHVDAWDGSEGGAILASRVVDTIKVSQDGRAIEGTSDRDKLWRAFTPQVFRFAELRHALSECQRLGLTVTDESSAIEHMGGAPCLVEGSDDNIKITRPHDLRLAADTLAARTQLGRG
ncbi:2-C-methyl-D-erythritol 4-phosphate cytidylyltransferase, partial [Oleiphilus sp. HI0061]